MLRTWWKILKIAVIAVGVLLTFFAFIEIVRAYQTLRDLHPAAGYIFLAAIIAALIWAAIYLFTTLVSIPRVLTAPAIGDPENASARQLQRYGRYLCRYMSRLNVNDNLTADDRSRIQAACDALKIQLKSIDKEAMRTAIHQTQEEAITPLLKILDDQAEKEIRACVGVVMTGVTLSPYKAADLIIVLYRNMVMALRIIRIYNTRPRFREQLRILSDIVNVVVTVNYINMGQNLMDGLLSHVPGIGRFTDDIAQGIGAGFMTSVVGHAAIYRCRAFSRWDRRRAQDTLRSRAAGFYADVRDIFKKDILPAIMKRLGDSSRDTLDKIVAVLDETGSRVGSFIKMPINIAVSAGGKVATGSGKTLQAIGRLFSRNKTDD